MSDSGDGNGAGGTLRECDVGAVGGARGGGAGKIHLSLHSLGAQEGIAALRQGERRFTEFQLKESGNCEERIDKNAPSLRAGSL
jgi:hypothetical protein